MKNNQPHLLKNETISSGLDAKAINAWIQSDLEFQIWNLEITNKMNEALHPPKQPFQKNIPKK